MAPVTERPPSEQGVEYRTFDALQELARKIDELAQRPSIVLPQHANWHANWWDVLPRVGPVGKEHSLADVLASGGMYYLGQLPCRNPAYNLSVRAALHPDRLELSLQLNGGWIVWQRALFYERRDP